MVKNMIYKLDFFKKHINLDNILTIVLKSSFRGVVPRKLLFGQSIAFLQELKLLVLPNWYYNLNEEHRKHCNIEYVVIVR